MKPVYGLALALFLPVTAPAADTSTLVTKLQVFLDQSPHKPGKIDGLWGGFTEKALVEYQKANGKGEVTFDGSDKARLPFDLSPVGEVFTEYVITEGDGQLVGELPADGEVEKKSKMESLPYADLKEAVGEKFHVDIDYLAELNPDTKFEVGARVKVPNVKTPFSLGEVKNADAPTNAEDTTVKIITSTNMLELHQGGKIVGTYPVSTGSDKVPAPKGDWKITSITYMPTFRHDEKMLEEGERSEDAHVLPPGPNSPVGIVWMAIDSDGIGIHGTSHPDTIGRADSHGCIRLSNWDAWELSRKLSAGVPVTIQ